MREPPLPHKKKKKEKTSWPPLGGSGRCAMGWQILPCYWLGSSTSREGSTLYGRRGFLQINRTYPFPPPPPPRTSSPLLSGPGRCAILLHIPRYSWFGSSMPREGSSLNIKSRFYDLASPRFKLYPPEPARTMRK